MSARNIQFVKWTFPAFALIIGFFWYKRRRVDRVDPGGSSKKVEKTQNNIDINLETNSECNSSNIDLYDSGIHINESFKNLEISNQSSTSEISVCSPRIVSESLDIPIKKSNSHSMMLNSRHNSLDANVWYRNVNGHIVMESAVLGSNPISSGFQLMSQSQEPFVFQQNICDNQYVGEEELTCVINNNVNSNQSCSRSMSIGTCSKQPITEVAAVKNKVHGQVNLERDSANHSPLSGVMDGSSSDEIRSNEGSTDSGKGGSINGNLKQISQVRYDFEIPQHLVGKLIGRHGRNIQVINSEASVTITVIRHPTSRHLKLCTIEGSSEGINLALNSIRQKFPERKYPGLTLKQINVASIPQNVPWITNLMQLQLIEGVNNDVIVCHIVEPNHIFVHIPTHPTYPSLSVLDTNMTRFYNNYEAPPVPDQLTKGMIVVANCNNKWVRAYVEKPDPNGLRNEVRLVDHGGFWAVSNAAMRKINSDFLTLPFQAIEVFISNAQPQNDKWCPEAYETVREICWGRVGVAQIKEYGVDGSVYVNLYFGIINVGIVCISSELMAKGYAESIFSNNLTPYQPML